MTKNRFWQQMQAAYPNQSFIKRLWNRFGVELWWSIDKNREFVDKIPDNGECFSYARGGRVINCICGKCFLDNATFFRKYNK